MLYMQNKKGFQSSGSQLGAISLSLGIEKRFALIHPTQTLPVASTVSEILLRMFVYKVLNEFVEVLFSQSKLIH